MEISNILLTFSIEKGLSERIKEAIKSFFEKSSWNTEKHEKFFPIIKFLKKTKNLDFCSHKMNSLVL